ncbi:asparagine synthase-related protein [Kitasatospora sp. NPDC001683]
MSPAEAIVKLVLRGQDPDGRLRELVTDALSRADGDLARGLTLADLATAWRPLVMTSDKLASAFALERRSPFLARDPVEFAYRLAVEHKIADPAAGKRILRDAAKALGLPREVWGSRDKLGFASPVPSWLSGPLEPWARAQISSALDQAPRGLQPLLAGGLRPGGRAVRPHPDAGPDGGGLVLPPHAGRCGMTDSRLITVSAWTPRLSPPPSAAEPRGAVAIITNRCGELLLHLRDDVDGIAWPGHWTRSPEFLRESFAILDTLRPDRIALGIEDGDTSSEAVFRAVHADILAKGSPLIVTGIATAELIKGVANAFLATKISDVAPIELSA